MLETTYRYPRPAPLPILMRRSSFGQRRMKHAAHKKILRPLSARTCGPADCVLVQLIVPMSLATTPWLIIWCLTMVALTGDGVDWSAIPEFGPGADDPSSAPVRLLWVDDWRSWCHSHGRGHL
ncbi:hypothetical protein VFPPC_17678 [Pochonia chlamydosporia 170]|uniref:Uncharacterized protein n=1 Tax=Pochonia chlamydosporia 170 TaxID=1380566 RepID=A0A219AQV7_METCM|nr:hypothetical protein VFPPC_17678 [Pochonia chlamydosporia 170]OWT43146.1 hypothetical protein VFPPC_17678 [Pochonia chlamydosporia 170]